MESRKLLNHILDVFWYSKIDYSVSYWIYGLVIFRTYIRWYYPDYTVFVNDVIDPQSYIFYTLLNRFLFFMFNVQSMKWENDRMVLKILSTFWHRSLTWIIPVHLHLSTFGYEGENLYGWSTHSSFIGFLQMLNVQ